MRVLLCPLTSPLAEPNSIWPRVIYLKLDARSAKVHPQPPLPRRRLPSLMLGIVVIVLWQIKLRATAPQPTRPPPPQWYCSLLVVMQGNLLARHRTS